MGSALCYSPCFVGRTHRSSILLYAGPLLAFVVSEAMARALGVRFADNTLGSLYQYLDPEILRNDLARGLYYLHAQPPLFNLFLGWVLKLFPGVSRAAFSVIYGLAGLAMLMGMAWLMERLGVSRVVNAALVFGDGLDSQLHRLPLLAFLHLAGGVRFSSPARSFWQSTSSRVGQSLLTVFPGARRYS